MSRLILLLCVTCLGMSSAYAELTIEITEGIDAAIPMAIVPFTEPDAMASIDPAEIVRADLQNSGQFSVAAPQGLYQKPQTRSQVNYSYFRRLGAELLVVGHLDRRVSGNFDLTFELIDVYDRKPTASPHANQVLLSKTYENIPQEQLRYLGHSVADDIFRQVTGIKGAFSTQIAYITVDYERKPREYRLEIADADGHNPRVLVRSPQPLMSPSWSPDGRQLAFVSFEKMRAEIFIVDLATGQRDRIAKYPGINGAPAWSPDGRQLALVLSKDGAPKIYLFDVDSRKLTQLTQGYSIDTEPTWAPDGQRLYFTSNRGGKPQIYSISKLGGASRRVTYHGSYNARPVLTPDGKKLVMVHRGEDQRFRIAVQDLATNDINVLTQASLDESPSISPNGLMVLYGTKVGYRNVLGAVSIDGRVHLRLPAREGSVQEPAWSPFLS